MKINSRKSARKPARKSSRKTSRKSRKTSRKPVRKSSRKTSRKSVRKSSRKTSRKPVRKAARKVTDILEEVEGKAIIWARWRQDIDSIVKAIEKEYPGSVMNYGALSTEDRAKAIKAIQDPNSKVRFLVTPQTGGYGNAKIMRLLKPWLIDFAHRSHGSAGWVMNYI